ncbi:MAG: alpha/beta fold hydrolase [Pseudomonadota bacterium]
MPVGRPRAYALFAHCFSCSKDIKAAREVARALRRKGFAVLRFDFTGLGASEGDFANTNFSSNVDDLVRAADFLRSDYEAPSVLIGHSLGGAAALVAATRIPELNGVATIAAPAEAAHVVAQLGESRDEIEAKGVAEVKLAGRPFTIKKQFLDDLENQTVLESAAKLAKPLLVLHAPVDETVGIENASRIFASAKHPKSFVSLDTADHLLSNARDAQYAAEVIAAWSVRFLPAPNEAGTEQIAPSQGASGAAGDVARGSGGKRIETPSGLPEVAPFDDGASAVLGQDLRLAVALSIDGYPVVIDGAPADGGNGLGPNPSRTVEGALAACSAMTMRLYADRKGWRLSGARVQVRRAPGEDSHVASRLEKSIVLEGDLDDGQRSRLFEIAGKCPVHRMLSEPVEIISSLEKTA